MVYLIFKSFKWAFLFQIGLIVSDLACSIIVYVFFSNGTIHQSFKYYLFVSNYSKGAQMYHSAPFVCIEYLSFSNGCILLFSRLLKWFSSRRFIFRSIFFCVYSLVSIPSCFRLTSYYKWIILNEFVDCFAILFIPIRANSIVYECTYK